MALLRRVNDLKLSGKVVVPFVLVGSYKVLEGCYDFFCKRPCEVLLVAYAFG